MNDNNILRIVTERVWAIADEVDWMHLTIPQRKSYYENWTQDLEIGGLLGRVMEPQRVRVYLKDTIMKTYSRRQKPELLTLLNRMSIVYGQISRRYNKPEALVLDGSRLYTLSIAREWKGSLMSTFERGYELADLELNWLYLTDHTTGRFVDQAYRGMIKLAGDRLGTSIYWVD